MPSSLRTSWQHGEKAELARRSGVSRHYLIDILAARRRPSPDMAERIENQAVSMGLDLTRMDLLYPKDSDSALMGTGGDQ